MAETNNKLFRKGEGVESQKDDGEVGELLGSWRVLNLLRAGFPAIATVLAAVAVGGL